MSSNTMPTISVPTTMIDKVKEYGNIDIKTNTLKNILDSFVNWVLEETSKGRSVVIPKAFKFDRCLLKERTFHTPGNRDKTSKKPARYALKITTMGPTKNAFEALDVDDNESDNDGEEVVSDAGSDGEETKPSKPKPSKAKGKGKGKPSKEAKPAKGKTASESETETEITPTSASASGSEEDVDTPKKVTKAPKEKKEKKEKEPKEKKAPKEPKEPKEKKPSKKTSKKPDEAVPEMVEEPYDDTGDFSDEN